MTRVLGWPVVLRDGPVTVRPIRYSDGQTWRELQQRNRDWLHRWEATVPPGSPYNMRLTYRQMVRRMLREARAGRMMPFAVEYTDTAAGEPARMVGQITVAGITWGSLCAANVGYWVDQRTAGRGIIPVATALVIDHCFTTVGLHRVEACIRPDNQPSRRVVEKLGLRQEGLRPAYLHIDGGWRDHVVYAITREEVPDGLMARLRASSTMTTPIDVT